jgi:hypothetical protein
MIQDSFIDKGKYCDDDFNLLGINFKQTLSKIDSESDLFGISENKISEWQVNQQSICYNLPALASFMSQDHFFQTLFPHLQSLCGNQYINPKLSTVLPQTVLCIRGDLNRAKLLELICQITNIAISDGDCSLMKNVMQDMPMLYKAFCMVPVEEQFALGITIQAHSGS